MFCADDRCSLPLHTLLADIVDGQGGSSLLLKIFNKLGICVSLDSLSRFVQDKTDQASTQCTHTLDEESFSVVSADNIDFQHHFAKVFKGNENASWHGASVHTVQPIPTLSYLFDDSQSSSTPPQSPQSISAPPQFVSAHQSVSAPPQSVSAHQSVSAPPQSVSAH